MRRRILAVLVGVLLGWTAAPRAQGSLSEQVLQLLSRTNTWTGVNTYANTVGITLQPGSVAPSPSTDRIYNVGGSLYWNGALVTTASGVGTVTSVALTMPGVFSVANSPVTSTGTLAVTLASQTANRFWAAPSGSSGAPTFRAMVDDDVPDTITINGTGNVSWASVSKSGSTLADLATASAADLSSGTLPTGRFPATLPVASGVNLTALNATNLTSGTVGAARMPAFSGDATSIAGATALTLADTAVTPGSYGDATHTLSATVDSKGRITALANVAISLTGVTIPSVVQGDTLYASGTNMLGVVAKSATATQYWSNTGSSNNPAWAYINLANGVTGTLPAANGGTSVTGTPTNGQLLIGNGSGYTLATLTGTANQITVTNNTGSITLSLPQGVDTTSTPQFARMGLGTGAGLNATLTTNGQFDLGFINGGSCGSALTFNWNSGEIQRTTLTAATCTLTFTNPIAGRTYLLQIAQDGTGGRLITWPGTVLWPAGVVPTLTAGANKIDLCQFVWNGASYLGACNRQNY